MTPSRQQVANGAALPKPKTKLKTKTNLVQLEGKPFPKKCFTALNSKSELMGVCLH